ncbi:hypothetical protein Anapl_03792 [Anas platyrhynchos]|uniref:Uncharacterized protein n=1 Tax=Anas platyrhynchos TaxID=8839 RepID=R0KBQ4_ANAPL|nr:hypothetical protein Anapl_03792 [Anas platyrhynchos]
MDALRQAACRTASLLGSQWRPQRRGRADGASFLPFPIREQRPPGKRDKQETGWQTAGTGSCPAGRGDTVGRGAGERGSPGPRSPGRARAWRTQPRRHERCRAGVKERAGQARSTAPSAATDATQKELRKTQGNLAVQEPEMLLLWDFKSLAGISKGFYKVHRPGLVKAHEESMEVIMELRQSANSIIHLAEVPLHPKSMQTYLVRYTEPITTKAKTFWYERPQLGRNQMPCITTTSRQRNNKNCIKADQEPAAVCGQTVYVNRNVTGNSTSIARSLSKQLQARGMLSRYSQLLKAPHLSVDSPCSPFHQNNRTSPLALLDKGVFKAKWILPKLQSCHFLQGQRCTPMQGGYQEDSRKGKAQQQATNVPLQTAAAYALCVQHRWNRILCARSSFVLLSGSEAPPFSTTTARSPLRRRQGLQSATQWLLAPP